MLQFFDSHSHYNDEKFNIDREEIIPETYKSGITSFVCAGYNLEGSKKALEIANNYPYIYATVGISPNDLTENWEEDVKEIEEILLQNSQHNQETAEEREEIIEEKNVNKTKEIDNKKTKISKIVAVGEIGLDYHYDTNKEWQKQAFIEQINLANKFQLPIVIHTREAVPATIEILKQNQVEKRGVFHCCPFNRELIKEALKLGYYISIAGPITFKNSKNAEEIANLVPLEKMLIETDSPYLAPEPVRGTRNDCRNVKYTAQKIADLRKTTLAEIAQATYANAQKIFNIQ